MINDRNVRDVMAGTDLPVVIDFFATWCGPSKMLAFVVEDLSREFHGRVLVCRCNVEESAVLSRRLGVRSVPTLVYIKDGCVMAKTVGETPKYAIAAKMKSLL